MNQIENFDELEEGVTYCYNKATDDEHTFTVEQWEDVEEGTCVTLSFKDGYVSDVTERTFSERIDSGRVYEVVDNE